jgi:hypothetical protein
MFIGIVTYNREDKFKEILQSIEKLDCKLLCVKDGSLNSYQHHDNLIQLDTNNGVGKCKNILINKFLESNEEHLFILEDDAKIKNIEVFHKCIEFSEESGLLHFNWNSYRNNSFSNIIQYKNFLCHSYNNTEANFSYFNRKFVEKIIFDENYKNAWEHLDIELQGHLQGFLPPFWYFVSPKFLDDDLECIDDGISTITNIGDYELNYNKGSEYFKNKYGMYVSQIPSKSKDEFIQSLKFIKDKYATK